MSISDRLAAITARANNATSLTLGDDNARDCYNIVEDDVPWLVEQVRKRDEAMQAVLDLHKPVDIEPSDTICGECSFQIANGRFLGKVEEWPCPTVLAIEAGLREDA